MSVCLFVCLFVWKPKAPERWVADPLKLNKYCSAPPWEGFRPKKNWNLKIWKKNFFLKKLMIFPQTWISRIFRIFDFFLKKILFFEKKFTGYAGHTYASSLIKQQDYFEIYCTAVDETMYTVYAHYCIYIIYSLRPWI